MIHQSNAIPCQQLLVASSAAGHVTTCPDCGHIHLSLPSLTLRFDVQVFRELAGLLRAAQHKLDTDPALHGAEMASALSRVVRH